MPAVLRAVSLCVLIIGSVFLLEPILSLSVTCLNFPMLAPSVLSVLIKN